MDVDPAVRRHCARLDWQFCPVQCYHFGVRLLQGLVHVNATDVDDSDKQLPITYKLVAADGFAIDNRRSASITLASAPAIDCTFDLLYKLCTSPNTRPLESHRITNSAEEWLIIMYKLQSYSDF